MKLVLPVLNFATISGTHIVHGIKMYQLNFNLSGGGGGGTYLRSQLPIHKWLSESNKDIHEYKNIEMSLFLHFRTTILTLSFLTLILTKANAHTNVPYTHSSNDWSRGLPFLSRHTYLPVVLWIIGTSHKALPHFKIYSSKLLLLASVNCKGPLSCFVNWPSIECNNPSPSHQKNIS